MTSTTKSKIAVALIPATIALFAVFLASAGLLFAAGLNGASGGRSDLTLELDMGNNDGAATPVVYDTSDTGADATAANAQTCDSDGCTFDGSADYMSATGTGIYNTANVSIAIEFTPDFDTDLNATKQLFSSTATTEYGVVKLSNASSNLLQLRLGNTGINIAEATYSPYWNVGQKNTLIVSGTTGNTNVWLNGNQILTNDATAWTPDNPATIYIGTRYDVAGFFDGTIHSFRTWQRILSTDEVAALSVSRKTRSTSASMVSETLSYDLGNNDGAATPVVYDTGSLGSDLTAANAMTCDNDGCTFDGSADYMSATGTGAYNNANVSIAIEFTPDDAADADVQQIIYDSTGGADRYYMFHQNDASSNVLQLILGGTLIESIALGAYSPYWNAGQKNVFIVSGTTGNTDAWLNGVQILTDDNAAWTPANPANLYLGANSAGAVNFDGVIHSYRTWQRILSADEVADISYSRRLRTRSPSLVSLAASYDLGNNDGAATPVVYDVGSVGTDLTAANAMTCDNDGCTFDGSADYMTATGTGVYNTNKVSMMVVFTPDFDPEDGVDHMFVDGVGDYYIRKFSDANNTIIARIGDANNIVSSSFPVYGQYWNYGERNVLIVTADTDINSDIGYLNGNAISTLTTDWNATNPATITVGSDDGGGNYFDGVIHSFRTWQRFLSADEALEVSLRQNKQL